MIEGRKFRRWAMEVENGDQVDVVFGNTLCVLRKGEVHDCLKISDFSLADFRARTVADPKADKADELWNEADKYMKKKAS